MSDNVKKSSAWFKFIGMLLVLILFISPFLLLVLNSFKANKQITSSPLSLPEQWNVANYANAMAKMNFWDGFFNSLLITACSVILLAIFSSMTAYHFVRQRNKLNNYMFFLMVAAMIVPFQALMIPLVKVYGSLGMLNNPWTLIFMYIGFGSSLSVFIYHGFLKSIPLELEEAAMMDGCTPMQTFFRIVFPVLTPTTTTIGILNVLWIWNDFLLPSLILTEPAKRTLPLSTFNFFGTYTVDYGPLMAGLMLSILPVIIVYLFAQRFIIQGVMQGSVK